MFKVGDIIEYRYQGAKAILIITEVFEDYYFFDRIVTNKEFEFHHMNVDLKNKENISNINSYSRFISNNPEDAVLMTI